MILSNGDFMPRKLDSNVKLWESFLKKTAHETNCWRSAGSDMQEIRIPCLCLEKIPEYMSFQEVGGLGVPIIL